MPDHLCPCGILGPHSPCPGGWGPVPERDWSWVKSNEFSELCKRATCEATDATHFHRLQDAHSAKSEPVTAGMAPDGLSLSAGPSSAKTCVVCSSTANVHLTVAPACQEHAAPDALERALAEARAEVEQIKAALRDDTYPCPGHHCEHGLSFETTFDTCPGCPEEDWEKWACPTYKDECDYRFTVGEDGDFDEWSGKSWTYPWIYCSDGSAHEAIAERLNDVEWKGDFWAIVAERQRLEKVMWPGGDYDWVEAWSREVERGETLPAAALAGGSGT